MKRFVYYQPNDNDLKDKAGDCQIRALSKALNKTWLETYDQVHEICRKYRRTLPFSGDLDTRKKMPDEFGFDYHGVSNKRGKKRPTVAGFAKEHPAGTFVLFVANHVVACVDGQYFDTWDCGECSMYGYYEKR